MEEIAAAGEPVMETVVDEDAIMQDVPVVVPMAEVGPSVEATRMTTRDTIKELLGIWSDGTIHRYFELTLVEITWQNLQETHRLRKLSDHRERLEQMMICWLGTLVAQGCTRNMASMWGKGKQKAEELDSDSEV